MDERKLCYQARRLLNLTKRISDEVSGINVVTDVTKGKV